ncbi:hypothetical protein Fcan01_07430 [Folsomia candida]|uniref:Uncharacterized protein n=1 Tax=Folsomia candida TaxID=158441 RepID=A0A226EHU0_FOLCA|nr:hypothetical protein Fcan01_07430 [Folsomia candida]
MHCIHAHNAFLVVKCLKQDWSWNKRNGILLKDHAQSYKWILSGLESNNTLGTFITFQRKWQTCDVQDVHFGVLSPMKIWWSFDNGTVKYENDKMRQELEKQQTGNSSASDLKNGTLTKTNKSIDATNVTTPTVAPSEEVEVLRSIKNSNFQGPVNFTFGDLLRNLTFFIMGCGESTTQFQCNASDIRKLQLANYSDLLSVGKISLKAFDSVKKDGKVQECSVAIDYANGGNEKKFHALFGFPKKSKGNKITQPDHAIFSVMIFIPYFLVQLSCSSDTCAPPCWY